VIGATDLAPLLPDYLPRQRWFGASDRVLEHVAIAEFELLRDEWPGLAWALADATFADGGTARYQVLVGLRPLEGGERFLEGKGRGVLGDLDTNAGAALVYDALVDPDLALALLAHVAPDEDVKRVRSLNVEQSNTSIVYDERLILKVFRRVQDGPNPDVEVTQGLADAGFTHISAPVASWSRDGLDLAVLRTFLSGGTDGWVLAQTSLRDMYDERLEPAECGGDFAPEASRLGEITASMHVALRDAFGSSPGNPADWADDMERHLSRLADAPLDRPLVEAAYERLRAVDDAGSAIRVHGDYHLGQTMRTDAGWYVLDFEGEPARPLAERRRPSSPLRDVAGMLRSFHYAARVGLAERGEEADDELATLGRHWEDRVASSFLEGYRHVEGVAELLPVDEGSDRAVLDAFLLDKAVYEVGYELAHRPDWVGIPLEAVERLLTGATNP
jgi:maltokinase